MANPSKYGLEASHGMMINYLYHIDSNTLQDRALKFLESDGQIIHIGDEIEAIRNSQ
jgi:hypothetical protein